MDDMSSLYEINRTLGTVLAKLEHIEEKISDIDDMNDRLRDVEKAHEAAKPFLEKASKWEQRGLGAGMVLTALGMIFGGVFVGFRDKILTSIGLH